MSSAWQHETSASSSERRERASQLAPPCRWAQMSLASVTSVAKAAEDDRIRRTYEVEDLDATFALAVGRRMRMAWRGFWTLCSETFALEFGSTSVFYEVGVSIALVLPLTVLCTWVTVTHGYTFGWEIYAFISFLLAFLLIFRLQTAYARYWEARTILAESKTSIISCGLLAVTLLGSLGSLSSAARWSQRVCAQRPVLDLCVRS